MSDVLERTTRWVVWAVALAALLSPAAAAQRSQVQARLDRQVMYVGDEAILTVIVVGEGEVGNPAIPKGTDFSFRGGNRSTSFSSSIRGGKMTQRNEVTFKYGVSALRAGELVIPPITIDVDGQLRKTEPILVTVTEVPESELFHVVQEVSNLDPYARQPIRVFLKFYISRDCDTPVFTIPWLASEDLRVDIPEGKRKGTAQLGITVPGQRGALRPFVQSEERFQGTMHKCYTLEMRVYPLREGSVMLTPITSRVEYTERTEVTRDFFGLPSRRAVKASEFISTEALELRVRPLPEEGRPEGFQGAVGKFLFTVDATPTQVDLGQPIDVTLRIRGDGLLDNLRAPDLASLFRITDDFKVSGDLVTLSSNEAGEKTFTQTLRARSADVTEIPSLEFPYFDPNTGKYEIARSDAVPLEVRATEHAGVGSLELTPDQDGSAIKSDVKSLASGIAELHTSVAALENHSVGAWFSAARIPLWAGPPLVYFAFLIGLARRRRVAGDEALLRRKGARKGAQQRLDAARAATEPGNRCDLVAKGLCSYIGDRTNTPAAGLTADEVAGRLQGHGVDESLVERVRTLIQECDLGRFAASNSADAEALLGRAEGLIRELEKVKL